MFHRAFFVSPSCGVRFGGRDEQCVWWWKCFDDSYRGGGGATWRRCEFGSTFDVGLNKTGVYSEHGLGHVRVRPNDKNWRELGESESVGEQRRGRPEGPRRRFNFSQAEEEKKKVEKARKKKAKPKKAPTPKMASPLESKGAKEEDGLIHLSSLLALGGFAFER